MRPDIDRATRRLSRLLCLLALLTGLARAHAVSVTTSYLEGQMPIAPDAVTTLGVDLFGDKVNLYNGAFEFEHVDLSLPGNNALSVALVRRYTPGRHPLVRGQWGDWDLSAPYITGIFSAPGWVTRSGGTNRCSGFSEPQSVVVGMAARIAAVDYWQGTHLHVPGHGTQELLQRALGYAFQPNDGPAYPLVTRLNWQIACLGTLQNAAGEGFLAISPEGVRYRFDWMAARALVGVRNRKGEAPRSEYFLFATEATDRHGNWVRYTYDALNPMQLQRIESSDGRVITLQYAGGRVAAASDGTRSIVYGYSAQGELKTVLQPDGSRWTFDLGPMLHPDFEMFGEGATCERPGVFLADPLVGTIVHPSGAVGSFTTAFRSHGKTFVQKACWYVSGTSGPTTGAVWSRMTSSQTLVAKSISGPGVTPMTWTYDYRGASGWASCTTCSDRKTVTVTAPDGSVSRHIFGNRWRVNEGQLLSLEEGWNGSSALRTTTYRYRQPDGLQAYPERFGNSPQIIGDWLAAGNRPQDLRVVEQQGAIFTWAADASPAGFDRLARPVKVDKFSSLGDRRAETIQYHDNPERWVLGQVESITETNTDIEIEGRAFDPFHALPSSQRSFGRLIERYEYYTDGTLYAIYNAGGRPVYLGEHKRGAPQVVTYADNDMETQVIGNLGRPLSRTNAAGTRHSYGYDAMGRINRVDYPIDDIAYHPTQVDFSAVATFEYGLAPGHWRQTVTTGHAVAVRYLDALWRERLLHRYDAAAPAATSSFVETRYDHEGRKTFESYPTRDFGAVDDATRAGRRSTYDALGRVLTQTEDSELGPLTTLTEYLPGVFQRRVTNARGHSTTFAFQAFDTPTEDSVVQIWAPEGVGIVIPRDVFGKALSITRGSVHAAVPPVTRWFTYDAHQRLCKTVEPETGATVQDYDASGNVAWRASGLGLTSQGLCNQGPEVPDSRKTFFGYDLRERLTTTHHGDGSATILRQYTPDSLLQAIWSDESVWTYTYNNRRLLKAEQLATLSLAQAPLHFVRGIDAHGHVATLTDPMGTIDYRPNALGQPSLVSGYAQGVGYHPNGALAHYSLLSGPGVHWVEQNLRGLPERWIDLGVQQLRYSYDAGGNVTGQYDELDGTAAVAMGYDGLDRLTVANGPWGLGSFEYDALDNIRVSQIGPRRLLHRHDPATNRLVGLEGSLAVGMRHDANGNLTWRGGQAYEFDIGNRLRNVVGRAQYAYDGHGRRHRVQRADGSVQVAAYGQSGNLLFTWDSVKGRTRYVYLGKKLLAEHNEQGGISFVHTDALGSPVARTNGAGLVLSRTRYEPYGATAAGLNPTGIGFTGHVNDADTGMVYMQQRYYDPIAGRFLSVDPVMTDAGTGGSFNRYVYGKDNPYRSKDPDGRSALDIGFFLIDAAKFGVAAYTGVGVQDAAADLAASTIGLVNPVPGVGQAIKAARAVDKTADAAGSYKKYIPGGKFSQATKADTAERAKQTCEYCGTQTVPAQKSERGVTPPKNEAQTDHNVPRSEGGTNSPDNAVHSCRECNRKYSDNPKRHPRE